MSTKIERQRSKKMVKALLLSENLSYEEWEFQQQRRYIEDHEDQVIAVLQQNAKGGNKNESSNGTTTNAY